MWKLECTKEKKLTPLNFSILKFPYFVVVISTNFIIKITMIFLCKWRNCNKGKYFMLEIAIKSKSACLIMENPGVKGRITISKIEVKVSTQVYQLKIPVTKDYIWKFTTIPKINACYFPFSSPFRNVKNMQFSHWSKY